MKKKEEKREKEREKEKGRRKESKKEEKERTERRKGEKKGKIVIEIFMMYPFFFPWEQNVRWTVKKSDEERTS